MRWPLAAGTSICVFLPDRRVWRREKARREGIGELLFLCCEGGVDVIFMPIILPIFAVKLMLLYPDRDAAHFQLLIALHFPYSNSLHHIQSTISIPSLCLQIFEIETKQKTLQFPNHQIIPMQHHPIFSIFWCFCVNISRFRMDPPLPICGSYYMRSAEGVVCVCVPSRCSMGPDLPTMRIHYIVMMMMFYFYCILVSVIVE